MKIKELTLELLDKMLLEQGIKLEKPNENNILTSKYVMDFNRKVGYRITQAQRSNIPVQSEISKIKIK